MNWDDVADLVNLLSFASFALILAVVFSAAFFLSRAWFPEEIKRNVNKYVHIIMRVLVVTFVASVVLAVLLSFFIDY